MQPYSSTAVADVWLARLREHPHRVALLAAYRLLVRAGKSVRFACDPRCSLALGELTSAHPSASDASTWQLTTAGLGLFGPASPLPFALAEHLSDDAYTREVLDQFHHRRMLLLCQGLAHADLPANLDGHDVWSRRILQLVGLTDIDPATALRLAPIFAAPERSPRALALALQRIVPELLTTPSVGARAVTCKLVPTTFTTPIIAADEPSGIGRATFRLGSTACLGSMVALPSAGARLVLGPLPATAIPSLQPGGTAHARITALLGAFVPEVDGLELAIMLDPASVPAGALGQRCIGNDLWLTRNRSDTPVPPRKIPLQPRA